MAETKTVEMLRGVCTAAGALNQGKIVDLPTAQADEFVRIGYAKPAKGKQAEQRIPASEFGAQERAETGPAETRKTTKKKTTRKKTTKKTEPDPVQDNEPDPFDNVPE